MPEHVIERLGMSTFVLRPDYDSVVADLGYEPPMGLPVELTFEWAWAAAEETVAQARRVEARKAATARRAAKAEAAKAPAKPAAKAPARTTRRKARGGASEA